MISLESNAVMILSHGLSRKSSTQSTLFYVRLRAAVENNHTIMTQVSMKLQNGLTSLSNPLLLRVIEPNERTP